MRKKLVTCWMLIAVFAVPAQAATNKTSLPDIEDEVMCPSCQVPLNTAQSPQAERERAFIRKLIKQGKTKPQIKKELVEEYGSSVLAVPQKGSEASFFAYALPGGIGVLAFIGVGFALWRWRRNSITVSKERQ